MLSRTTRAVVPTEAGAEFLARIEPILAALDEAENAVRDGDEFRGVLRISTPTSFGVRTLIPRLSGFVARHPALRVELQLEDRRQDLVRDEVHMHREPTPEGFRHIVRRGRGSRLEPLAFPDLVLPVDELLG